MGKKLNFSEIWVKSEEYYLQSLQSIFRASERIIKWYDDRIRKRCNKLSKDNMKEAFQYLEDRKYGGQKPVKQKRS